MNNVPQIGSSILTITAGLVMAAVDYCLGANVYPAALFHQQRRVVSCGFADPVECHALRHDTVGCVQDEHQWQRLFQPALLRHLRGQRERPDAALTLSGTNLYGMTVEGGAGVGVAFRVSTNGIGYTALHYFNGTRRPTGRCLMVR